MSADSVAAGSNVGRVFCGEQVPTSPENAMDRRPNAMNPVVAVIAPGMMGAAVGKRLVDHGLKVLTSLEGRSAETAARAKAAGMTPAPDEEIAATDFILSILPPGDAVALAQRFAPALTASNSKPVDRKSTRLNSSHLGISYAV